MNKKMEMMLINLKNDKLRNRLFSDAKMEIIEDNAKWQKRQYVWPDGEEGKFMFCSSGAYWEM